MEISVEVNTSKTETTEDKKDEKITDSVEMKIPPKTKIANYLWSTNQIVRFTSTLRVSGQVGVYFQKEICNAYVSIDLKASLLKQKRNSYLLISVSRFKEDQKTDFANSNLVNRKNLLLFLKS